MNSGSRRKRTLADHGNQYSPSRLDVGRLIEQICTSGKISRRQHLHLMTALLSNEVTDRGDRQRINQILEAARAGELRIVS